MAWFPRTSMILKSIYDTEADIPEVYRPLYKQAATGKHELAEVEGIEPAAKVNEYRNSNISVMRERDELRKKLEPYEGVDVELYHRLRSIEGDLVEHKLVKNDKVEEVVAKRTQALRQELERDLDKERKRAVALEAKLSEMVVDEGATRAAAKFNARPQAIQFIVDRVRGVTKLENGVPVIYKNGEKAYGKSSENNGLKTIDEEVEELIAQNNFLAMSSEGGGSTARSSGTATGGNGAEPFNPWKKETYNLTRCMEIAKKDPQKAARMRAEAGILS